MCTWIVERTPVDGSAKGPNGWFELNQANVYYDHPYHAPLDHALIIDFVETPDQVGNRVAVELSEAAARRLVASILAALESGEEGHPTRVEVSAATA
ncbi:MAG: DUF6295 family protein [Chloroflexi bacterium]|nr:DUF6295 family protein [Chloroflexota bacterium]MDA1145675.1 DUF6295 family protein [Chloroflexota bacterium]